MTDLQARISESVAAIRLHWPETPAVGIVLGSGMGDFVAALNQAVSLPTTSIPHFVKSTAIGHAGFIHGGTLANRTVMIQQGRVHAYEGYSFDELVYSVRVMHALGVRTLILTNASGALNPSYQIGDVVVLKDHINFMFGNPLRGPNDDSLGPRFPDMCDSYDTKLRQIACRAALEVTPQVHEGVYVGMLGPCYETRAEYQLLQRLGGDLVGMSTVPENIAARHCGMQVLGLSVVSNLIDTATDGHTVLANVSAAQSKVRHIMTRVVEQLS